MPKPVELEPVEVLDAIREADSRQGPTFTVTDVALMFPDFSKPTIRRKLTQLVDVGELNYKESGRANIYWTRTMFACPHCGADVERTEDYHETLSCMNCEARYVEIQSEDGITKTGRSVWHGRELLKWWVNLPDFIRKRIQKYTINWEDRERERFEAEQMREAAENSEQIEAES